MSINSIYEVALKGDFNQIKVKVDENESLIKTTDESTEPHYYEYLQNGRLLLHWAAISGNENLVDFLIDNGSPVNSIDDTNSSALTLAASAGRLTVVKLLIDRGAVVNQQNNRGQSSLHYACSKGHIEVAKLLIKAGANVNQTDHLKATPLHRAAAQGRSNIVELLLQSPELKIDAQDCTGSSPLHLACEEDREAVAFMLVKAGSNTQIENVEKKSPLDLCSTRFKKSLIALLD